MFICLAVPFSTIAAIRYVNVNSTNPAPPYTNWATAATVIQDAVDVAVAGDEVVVTNGVYQSGERSVSGTRNRVAVTKPITLRSVNGGEMTVIRGYQVPGTTNGTAAVRCVYLANGAALVGFTLTDGATCDSCGPPYEVNDGGGGVVCESASSIVSNCVMIGNSALYGGGAMGGTLMNCTLTSNSAEVGGGAYQSLLKNCIVSDNSATIESGGVYGSTLNNCLLIAEANRIVGQLETRLLQLLPGEKSSEGTSTLGTESN